MKSRKWRFKIIYIIKLFAHINMSTIGGQTAELNGLNP